MKKSNISQSKSLSLISFIRDLYKTKDYIPLHIPRFNGNEKNYINECIDSTYVSSVGKMVESFEESLVSYTKIKYAVATVNGTSALHTSLKLAGVEKGDSIITQSLTFVATCNAINYCQAQPIFLDIDKDTLGLSAESLESYLNDYCEIRDDGFCWERKTNSIIRACIPMHTFGFPVKLDEIRSLTRRYNIILIEDAAESLGSFYKDKHTGIIGDIAIMSFNGNKIITSGGGGMIMTNSKQIASAAKHITTTAKISHKWEFNHDQIGFNYRLPNLNAALGLSQMEQIDGFISNKRKIAKAYQEWGDENDIRFFHEPKDSISNYWLNVMIADSKKERDEMLEYTNHNGIMTRPAWTPMHKLPMFEDCIKVNLENTEYFADLLINVPSSVTI